MTEAAETEQCTPIATLPYFFKNSLNRAPAIDSIYLYIYIYVCMCACNGEGKEEGKKFSGRHNSCLSGLVICYL